MKEYICAETQVINCIGATTGTTLWKGKELVRCKDCKHSEFDEGTGFYVCQHPFGLCGMAHLATWFCADGERKEEGQ